MQTILTRSCTSCKQAFELKVQAEDLAAWEGGMIIQRAFPYLSADQRELLISGICGKCFDDMFGDEDEE